MNMTTIMQALEIMGKGMLGIFVAIIVIMVFVMLMAKFGSNDKDQKES